MAIFVMQRRLHASDGKSVREKGRFIINAEGLVKHYGSIKAVDGISIKIRKGEVYSLLGPNGAGKTTTVEMLEGLRKPDHGRINVLGLDPFADADVLHRREGIIPQGFNFIEKITAKEAIGYYATLFGVKNRAKELLELTNLTDVADVNFMDLSGGQKQKVGLCLALSNDPEILFLDEPTVGLDPQARRNIQDVIRRLKSEKRTIILTTHYLEEAEELADRVAIINHGKIMAEGTPQEIIREYGDGMKLSVSAAPVLAKAFDGRKGMSARYDSGRVIVALESDAKISKAIRIIENSGQEWSNLKLNNETLEDVFLSLVGKKEKE